MEPVLPLSVRERLPRIFAHDAYAKVRDTRIAPIVFLEALALAAFFPVLWQAEGGRMRLVVLRSLGYGETPTAEGTLPLILRAFPMRNRDESDYAVFAPCLDTEPADRPTNIGSPVFASDGQLTLGAKHRARSLVLYARNVADTEALTYAIQQFDMLVPWDLKDRVAGTAEVPDGLFVAKDPAGIADMPQFLALFRQKGANLLTAHRLSMYRTAGLLPRARGSTTDLSSLA